MGGDQRLQIVTGDDETAGLAIDMAEGGFGGDHLVETI